MKYTHVYRPGTDPGLTVLEINDSNNTPYVPGSAETTAAGALTWEGRDIYVSECPGCAATGDQSPCAQRIYLRDLDEVVIHESDIPVASKG
jgi:hypothetical protein